MLKFWEAFLKLESVLQGKGAVGSGSASHSFIYLIVVWAFMALFTPIALHLFFIPTLLSFVFHPTLLSLLSVP